MVALSDAEVTRLLPALSERARASTRIAGEFRAPTTGIVEQVGSDWHHFVVGRRGVGKSMLLLTVAEHARSRGRAVAYIDIEKLRDNPYPDVLIRLLIRVAQSLAGELKGSKRFWQKRRARKNLAKLSSRLEELLQNPQEAAYRIADSQSVKRRRAKSGKAKAGAERRGLGLAGEIARESEHAAEAMKATEATFVRTKLDGLRAEATEFGETLEEAMHALGDVGAFVVLDDFYFIPRSDQPDVLSYLQQVVKNLNIWLKIGAVEHRLNEFADGDPPRGLQLTQDAGKVQMDVTLTDFDHTRAFLEGILDDICDSVDVESDRLLTENARLRLVAASGGVPRDYINLIAEALGKSTRRTDRDPSRPRNRITSEDVNQAAPEFRKQKEEDLRVDSSPEDSERLRQRLNEVLNFCVVDRKTNVFTVDARLLREEQWARDIAALADLRFFHRFGQLTVKSSDPSYVGQRYEGFVLDLSSYATARVTTNEVDFWTPAGYQRARGVSYVYTPEIAATLQAQRPAVKEKKKAEQLQVAGQTNIFEMIDAVAAEAEAESPTRQLED